MEATLQQQSRRARAAVALVATAAALAVVPAHAGAVTLTLSDDNGAPQPWAGEPALRTMRPSVGIAFGAGENGNYSATYAGPDGAPVSSPISCYSINTNRELDYRGNGAYTVTVQKFAESDTNCRTPIATQGYRFSINAGVTLAGPATRVLIRKPDSFVTNPIPLAFAGNPGMLAPEVRYALNGAVGPDGGLAGASTEAFPDTTGTVPLRITTPGRYVVVARAKGFTASTAGGQFFSPWTPPLTVAAVAPFDFESSRTTDSRGPSYRISLRIREHSARGKVSIAYARGKKGGKYHSLGSVKISSKATISKRFTLHRTGTYRMRFRFKGSPTVAAGTVVQKFKITRHFAF